MFEGVLDRNGSQIHRMRSNFESERKAHRKQFYDSIIRNERSAETMVNKAARTKIDNLAIMNPRWNKSLVKETGIKRRLFHDHNHNGLNNSISVPADQDSEFSLA